ncbi:sugar phosphate isomerase/epimerase family protein [Ktedonospora formicarum]|uniref:Sugar phosphate isomerase n=1 Tax=Ktedonospora formicarum TaxID=2778364 RepID=A0A8J3MV30_9CHLR|nr:sugar phosphate isomerase/epimerase [Ktedonospora formicarum]GHO47501.1 sugar phosphate isomerase [Ktedonospora formicarum]
MSIIALQLYTVRDETARDFAGTLRRVSELGYPAVEFADYGGLSIPQMQALLAETGLQALSSHISLESLEQRFEQETAYALAIGCPTLIVPWLPPHQRTTEALTMLAGTLNHLGRKARACGLTLGYHNHDFEFAPISDKNPTLVLDYLIEQTDPASVSFELDTYWAAFAGVDPVEYLQRHAGRVTLVHVKDMTPERTFTEVGAGILPIAEIVAAARTSGVQGFLVENDQPRIPSLESAKRSLQFLRMLPE